MSCDRRLLCRASEILSLSIVRLLSAFSNWTNSCCRYAQRRGGTCTRLTLSPPIPLRLYTLPYWCNPLFLIFDVQTERQSARMSKIKNNGLDQYGAEPFEQQQFGAAGIEGVKAVLKVTQFPMESSGDCLELACCALCWQCKPQLPTVRQLFCIQFACSPLIRISARPFRNQQSVAVILYTMSERLH